MLRLKEKIGLVGEAIQVPQDTVTTSKTMNGPTDPGTLRGCSGAHQSPEQNRQKNEAMMAALECIR